MATRESLGEILEAAGLLDEPAAEVGVWEGDYAACILRWGIPKLYLVDLWEHVPGGGSMTALAQGKHTAAYRKCMERVGEFDAEVEVLQGWSHEMADQIEDGTLGFCYIDASHDYENTLRDLRSYWPKLLPNGIMAGHDYPMEGVNQAVHEFADEKDLKINLMPVPGDPNDASFWLERR